MNVLSNALSLVINIIVDLYIYVLLARLLFQKFGAPWHNPICQFVVRMTEPVIKPFRKVLPGIGGFDLAIIALAMILEGVQAYLVFLIKFGTMINLLGALVLVVGYLGIKLVNIFFYATIIGAIMSWFPALQYSNPLGAIIHLITEPLLRQARRFIPIISGFDFSPLVIIIVLLLVNVLVFNQIILFGTRLALG